jgi:hypothetical protein
MKKLFLTLAGVVGSIPGIAVWQSGLGTPPDKNLLFGGVVQAFGAISLLLLWVNRAKLKLIPKPKITRLVVYLIVTCFAMLSIYLWLFGLTVVQHEFRGTAYYPIWTSGEIAIMVESADNSRYYAIEKYGIDAVKEAIHKMPNAALAITTIVLLFIYQAIFSTLTIAFGVLGIQEESSL